MFNVARNISSRPGGNIISLLPLQESIEKRPRNVLWSLPEQCLYESIDVKSGHVEGFNKEVLVNLIKPYLVKPTITDSNVDNSEYLGPDKYLHNMKNKYNRHYGVRMHRHVYSRRPRHLAKPDKEMWEKLFRLRHPEQSFAGLGQRELNWYNMAKYDYMGKFHWHPEFRALDYYIPAYQPAKFRPEGKKKYQGYNRVKAVFPPIPDEEDKYVK